MTINLKAFCWSDDADSYRADLACRARVACAAAGLAGTCMTDPASSNQSMGLHE